MAATNNQINASGDRWQYADPTGGNTATTPVVMKTATPGKAVYLTNLIFRATLTGAAEFTIEDTDNNVLFRQQLASGVNIIQPAILCLFTPVGKGIQYRISAALTNSFVNAQGVTV